MSVQNYAILRTLKVKNYKELASLSMHWLRKTKTLNADLSRQKYNKIIYGNKNPYIGVKEILKKRSIRKLRKNGVLAIEFVLAFSPEYLLDESGVYKSDAKERLRKWISKSKDWLLSTYGENCISAIVHFDEKSPHIHALITPIKSIENKSGETLNKLCARDITGGSKKLSLMQDSYAQHLESGGVELRRGIKNSKATHQTLKHYYTALNESKLICEKSGLIAPEGNPEDFNIWLETVKKLTDSINTNNDQEKEKMKILIAQLAATNQKLQLELNNRRVNRYNR